MKVFWIYGTAIACLHSFGNPRSPSGTSELTFLAIMASNNNRRGIVTARSLYELSLTRSWMVFTTDDRFKDKDFRNVPDNVLFDFYNMMFDQGQLAMLLGELHDWQMFARMLTFKPCRVDLLRMFQALLNHDCHMWEDLMLSYMKHVSENLDNIEQSIEVGLHFAVFLCEGAWYKCAHDLLNHLQEYISQWNASNTWRKKLISLEFLQRRMFVEANYALFDNAKRTLDSSNVLQQAVENEAQRTSKKLPNFASLYATFTHLFTLRGEYDQAFEWGMKAIALLNSDMLKSTNLFVLKTVAKVCVVKRRYSEGNFLIQQALMLATELYSLDMHPSFADTLMVYGFFLLNSDNIAESVQIYKKALDVRLSVFGTNNMHVAFAYEELAYALYVNEYSSGDFQSALEYANKATSILENYLPANHLSLAYTKRVKGLIMEEVALDMREPHEFEQRGILLLQAEILHNRALALSLQTFGQNNVQTAKHYGNLGRVYQSMNEFDKAERMQLLAIRIKESILGMWDYEVGLSIGHLASLYNFHMDRFEDAEPYYLRSIEIGKNLFGETYSGLVYDYRGLIKVYTKLDRPELVDRYRDLMHKWYEMRQNPVSFERYTDLLPIKKIVQLFLNWERVQNGESRRKEQELACVS